jgi:hypothetical protein
LDFGEGVVMQRTYKILRLKYAITLKICFYFHV